MVVRLEGEINGESVVLYRNKDSPGSPEIWDAVIPATLNGKYVIGLTGRTIGGAVRYRFSLPERKRFGFLFGVYQTYELMDACLLWLPYPLMLVNRALCGFLGIQSATIRQAAVQRYIPDWLRARLNAYESLLCTAAGAVLSLAIGALGEVLDYRLCICGLTTMLVCWLTVFLRRHQVQQVLSGHPHAACPGEPQ